MKFSNSVSLLVQQPSCCLLVRIRISIIIHQPPVIPADRPRNVSIINETKPPISAINIKILCQQEQQRKKCCCSSHHLLLNF